MYHQSPEELGSFSPAPDPYHKVKAQQHNSLLGPHASPSLLGIKFVERGGRALTGLHPRLHPKKLAVAGAVQGPSLIVCSLSCKGLGISISLITTELREAK